MKDEEKDIAGLIDECCNDIKDFMVNRKEICNLIDECSAELRGFLNDKKDKYDVNTFLTSLIRVSCEIAYMHTETTINELKKGLKEGIDIVMGILVKGSKAEEDNEG